MALNDSRNAAAVSAPTVFGPLAQFTAALSNLFQATTPLERERMAHHVTLVLIIAVGAYARFFALGHVGFHGDEETMALAVRHILQDGTPILPSGMFYPRGMTQLYLMALSASAFGMNEWALRLPSAICGVLLIPLLYFAGKRFLRPQWNLALAAGVALLPEIVEYSQTARMYIFLLASVATMLICVFEWERTNRLSWLVAATVALIIGMDFQLLAATMVLLFAYPGILRGSLSRLLWGAGAGALTIAAYLLINHLVTSQYPHTAAEIVRVGARPVWYAAYATHGRLTEIAFWGVGVLVVWAGIYNARLCATRFTRVACAMFFVAGTIAQLVVFYHIAFLLYLAAVTVLWRSSGNRAAARLGIFVACVAVLAVAHIVLIAATAGSVIKLVGALVGQPSVWPYVRIADFSPLGGVLAIGTLVWGVWDLAHAQRAKDVALFAFLAVWIPVFMIGFFTWNMPPRYAAASLDAIMICAFACAQHVFDFLKARWLARDGSGWLQPLAAAAVAIVVINPAQARTVINSDYSRYPDHQGAALFLRAQHLSKDDVVLAEDVLEQTYYLDSVDYWLIGPGVGKQYSRRTPDGLRDIYTNTRVILSAEELRRVIEENRGRRIFIIGSGEEQKDGRRFARGEELHALLSSNLFEGIYLGRDKLTRVLRPASDASFSREEVAKVVTSGQTPNSQQAR
jgi:4-amino-4-deoxy-L-arabinose transferase-like glycosyltransferase